MMDILLILITVIIFASLMPKFKSIDDIKSEIVVDSVCPPHKWEYLELKDAQGNVKKHRLICKICGPLRPIEAKENK